MAVMRGGWFRKPSEGTLHEWLCVFLDARAMSDDQLVEIPRQAAFRVIAARGLDW